MKTLFIWCIRYEAARFNPFHNKDSFVPDFCNDSGFSNKSWNSTQKFQLGLATLLIYFHLFLVVILSWILIRIEGWSSFSGCWWIISEFLLIWVKIKRMFIWSQHNIFLTLRARDLSSHNSGMLLAFVGTELNKKL